MRIEMVLPAMPAAGMEMVVARLTRGLCARGHEVGITCIETIGTLGEQMVREGYRVSVIPTPGLMANFTESPLTSWFRSLRPDVVHVHSGAWLKAATAAAHVGVPRIVATQHGLEMGDRWTGRMYDRLAARRIQHVIAVAEPLRARLVQRCGVPAEKVSVIPNGVSLSAFKPRPGSVAFRRALGIAVDAFVIGTVARLSPVKNQAMLVDGLSRLRSNGVNAYAVIAGDGPLRADLEARAAALGISSHVRFLGVVQDTAPLYPEFDVFALTSLSEGTSISLLEAMASGVSVVATSVGGTPTLLRDGELGALVPANDVDALARELADLARTPARREAFARAALQVVANEYTEESMLDRHETIYRGQPRSETMAPAVKGACAA